jgi:predicted small secreted protein
MTTPAPTPAPAAPASVPGKTLGIVGLILAFFGPVSLIGLILSIVAKVQSKNAGVKNTPATAGIIVSIIVIVLTIIFWVVIAGTLLAACNGLEPGVYDTGNGGTLTCG